MTDIGTVISALHRPRILVRAARAGLRDYRRDRDLKRLLRTAKSATGRRPLSTLLEEEDRLEGIRSRGDANYSIQRHVAVLTALLAEARITTGGAPA